jgi:hypothetical protein
MPFGSTCRGDNLDCKINDITPNSAALGGYENIGCPELKYPEI